MDDLAHYSANTLDINVNLPSFAQQPIYTRSLNSSYMDSSRLSPTVSHVVIMNYFGNILLSENEQRVKLLPHMH